MKRLKHLKQKLQAVKDLKISIEHEHNFALSILKELGDIAKDIIDLRTRIEKLERKNKC